MSSSLSSPSLSSALCLRLVVVGRVAVGVGVVAIGVAMTGSSWVLAGRSWGGSWAEDNGNVEAGEFERAGRSEAFGEGTFGAVSSARTNAGAGYPQGCEYTEERRSSSQFAGWKNMAGTM